MNKNTNMNSTKKTTMYKNKLKYISPLFIKQFYKLLFYNL